MHARYSRWLVASLMLAVFVVGIGRTTKAVVVDDDRHEYSIVAGNAFFRQTDTLGMVCEYNFGDRAGAYNALTGFNAAHVYDKPGDYTVTVRRFGAPDARTIIHVLPDRRPVTRLQKGDNLSDIVKGLRNDTVVLLPAGSTWEVTRPVEVKARNIEFRPDGDGPAPRIVRAGAGGTSTFVLQGSDITFRGIEFDSDKDLKTYGNQKVNFRCITGDTAHLVIRDCTFRNIDDAIFCTPLTRGVLVQNCTFTDEIRACDVWCDGRDLVLLGNKMATSQREHNIRCSNPGFYNLMLCDNDITNTDRKETLTFRAGQDLYVTRNVLHTGWIAVGPGGGGAHKNMTQAEMQKMFVHHIVVEHNTFRDGSYMQVNRGAVGVRIRGNRMNVETQDVPVRIQGPDLQDIVIEENCRVLTKGPNAKPMVRLYDAGPEVTERGSRTATKEEAEKAAKME